MGHQLHVSVKTWGIVLSMTLSYVGLAYLYAHLFPVACQEEDDLLGSESGEADAAATELGEAIAEEIASSGCVHTGTGGHRRRRRRP
eukprot:SAG22_NODE_549_length_9239_cov_7.477899_10_plen_87_part_00